MAIGRERYAYEVQPKDYQSRIKVRRFAHGDYREQEVNGVAYGVPVKCGEQIRAIPDTEVEMGGYEPSSMHQGREDLPQVVAIVGHRGKVLLHAILTPDQ